MYLDKVATYITQHNLLQAAERVLVGVSGGADSVVLLHILNRLGYSCEVAHCNFHLRGEEADRDTRFVEDLCSTLHIPLHVKHFSTKQYAKEQNLSIEMAARELRYAWFEQLLDMTHCSSIAVAHHQNDQAETLLMNLSRGSGLKGLGGIRPQNGHVIRPLLCLTRREIEQYAADNTLSYVTDSTNADTSIRRNAWRALMTNLSEQDIRNFAQSAELMQQYYALLQDLLYGHSAPQSTVTFEAEPTLLYELLAPLGFNAGQTEDIRRSLNTSGRRFVSPTFTAITDHGKLNISASLKSDKNTINTPIIHISRRKRKTKETFPETIDHIAFFDADRLPAHLTIRHWQEGDTFYPLTNNSRPFRRKLQDFFSDNKLSVNEKQQVLVVCDADNPATIVWLVGLRSDNRFKVTPATTTIAEISIDDVIS